ncbi:MAG: hypothetical protein JKX76_02860 [Colwellia sp.]|nr:hypothetical protein [Colwellia sp.]
MIKQIPYGDIARKLHDSIFKALLICCNLDDKGKQILITNKELHKCFEWLIEKPYYSANRSPNKHLTVGLRPKERTRGTYSRLVKLTIQAYKGAQEIARQKKFKGYMLPSPLFILYSMLTVPSELQSSAYALLTCRSLIFDRFKTYPPHPDIQELKIERMAPLNAQEIQDAVEKFRSYIKISDNFPINTGNPNGAVTAHFLAMLGILYLRFRNEKRKYGNKSVAAHIKYLMSLDINGGKEEEGPCYYEFRISDDYRDLPDSTELLNLLWGIPIPIRGADTIFFGGLRKAHNSSLVISLSAKAGVGKTSVALALAASLAPFNTRCLYLTLEESKEDLTNRLVSIIPNYLRKLSIYEHYSEWFIPEEIKISHESGLGQFTKYLEKLRELVEPSALEKEQLLKEGIMPAVCPFIIVIDHITGLTSNESDTKKPYYELEEFVTICRKLRALVILISGDDIPRASNLDYLVDISINLKHEGTDLINEKPYRMLQLLKTRHQISRPGSHIFHLSGAEGFRISPQIPSQLDRKEELKRQLPDLSRIINTLNIIGDDHRVSRKPQKKIIELYPRSQILIHGYGSSGKSGLALKILLSPPIEKQNIKSYLTEDYARSQYRRKILVVSFLYPQEFYEKQIRKINVLNSIYKGLESPIVTYIQLFPGFLSPEDFIGKVSRYLDMAIMDGEPYTGILLDGLHNVFLQFRKLQERDMVWPMLYNMLSRYKLSIVTTFTNFSITEDTGNLNSSDSYVEQRPVKYHDDQLLIQKGQIPFLHALVQATDFYLMLNPSVQEQSVIAYKLTIKSAINQNFASVHWSWDRENIIFKEVTEFQGRLF